MWFEYLLIGIVGISSGIFLQIYFLHNSKKNSTIKTDHILQEAQTEAKNLKEKAKEASEKYLEEVTKECTDILQSLESKNELYNTREENIRKKEESLKQLQQSITDRERNIDDIKDEIENLKKKEVEELIKIANIDYNRACEELKNKVDSTYQSDYNIRVKSRYENLLETADQDGINIINSVIQRYAKKNASRVTFVPIAVTKSFLKEQEENIEELKKATEVEIEFDEEESVLFINHYNIVRRTAAYNVLQKMVQQKKGKKIDIKELLKNESDSIHKDMDKIGGIIVKELKIKDLPKEIIQLIGRLNYRTSFGQNIMSHSLEVAFFATMLAYELGADPEKTKVAALLHDLGKSVDQDIEGPHDVLTKKILEKYGIDEDIVHAAYNHHSAEEMKSLEARIVQAADAMSASRPGARIEAGEQYIERIKALEETALSIEGISKAYAIQAGREIRSFVDPDKISDEDLAGIAKELAHKIEEGVQYPGQVMVNIIREFKVTEHAK